MRLTRKKARDVVESSNKVSIHTSMNIPPESDANDARLTVLVANKNNKDNEN